jgi:hypothetical protein
VKLAYTLLNKLGPKNEQILKPGDRVSPATRDTRDHVTHDDTRDHVTHGDTRDHVTHGDTRDHVSLCDTVVLAMCPLLCDSRSIHPV